MKSEEILNDLAVKIYDSPLSHLRDDGRIADLANPVAVVMLLIDFETEVLMNGIENFFGNFTGRYVPETIQALKIIGCREEGKILDEMRHLAEEAGMTFEALQKDMEGREGYSISSWSRQHGDKWNPVLEQISALADRIDFETVFARVEEYIDVHKEAFLAALNAAKS